MLVGARGGQDDIALTGALTSASVADAADCSPHYIHFQTSDYVNLGKLSLPKRCIYHRLC